MNTTQKGVNVIVAYYDQKFFLTGEFTPRTRGSFDSPGDPAEFFLTSVTFVDDSRELLFFLSERHRLALESLAIHSLINSQFNEGDF